MSRLHLAATSFLFATLLAATAAPITFGPVRGQAGQSVQLITRSNTDGGTIETTVDGQKKSGTVVLSRDRDLVWTFRDPAPDGARRGMVKVNKIDTTGKTVIAGKTENIADVSPLNGKMFSMSKEPGAEWTFQLDGSVPLMRVEREINELKIYLKRDWYPAREVNAGDSWEFDPSWIRMLIERDFSNAQTIGTMRLKQVRHTAERNLAVIEVSIRSTGAGFEADGSSEDGSLVLKGEVFVNLNTMLDERLELKGSLVTTSRKDGVDTKMKLPIDLVVTKTFVRDF